MRFAALPAEVRRILTDLFPGQVVRISKRDKPPLSTIVRDMHRTNLEIYEMSEAESVREICKRIRRKSTGRQIRASEVRRLLAECERDP